MTALLLVQFRLVTLKRRRASPAPAGRRTPYISQLKAWPRLDSNLHNSHFPYMKGSLSNEFGLPHIISDQTSCWP
jgi:hypothetical protein